MSPKFIADRTEDERHPRLRQCPVRRRDAQKRQRRPTTKKKLKLNELEANKSMYICSLERQGAEKHASFVVRALNLSDLLSSTDDVLQLHQVAHKAGMDLPEYASCGVFGSQILFIGGCIRENEPSAVWSRDVYAFETDSNKDPSPVIRKMDATLVGAKYVPLVVEVGGKVYALCLTGEQQVLYPPAFEVFDPKVGTWSPLPRPPFYLYSGPCGFAIAGTKLFASHEERPVFCFDLAHPEREWRQVHTMCDGGAFPFLGTALVLDLPPAAGDSNKKILFGHDIRGCYNLGVYLMSLDENQESITRIGFLNLPKWPCELGAAGWSNFVHIGGRKACLVITQFLHPQERPIYKLGTHKKLGVAIPFQFELDITKLDKDQKNCFTLQFMPPRIFEYHTNPSTYPSTETAGCFVL